jgi:manganese/zinc/iron transport system substrate-binding protein
MNDFPTNPMRIVCRPDGASASLRRDTRPSRRAGRAAWPRATGARHVNAVGLAAMALAAACVAAGGCVQGEANDKPALGYPIRVACTTDPVAEAIERLGGKHVRVVTLVPPGADPHRYKLDSAGLLKLREARVIVSNGLELEQGMLDALEQAQARAHWFGMADGERDEGGSRLLRAATNEGGYDPHVWQDPSLWARCVDYAAERLSEIDPAHAADYRRRGEAYCEELAELYQFCKDSVREIPVRKRVLVSAHEAFNYVGAAHRLELYAPQGVNTQDEVDLYVIDDLPGMLAYRGIDSVFLEYSAPARHLQMLVDRCREKGHDRLQVRPLYSGGFGPSHARVDSYDRMIRHNMNTLVEALR